MKNKGGGGGGGQIMCIMGNVVVANCSLNLISKDQIQNFVSYRHFN